MVFDYSARQLQFDFDLHVM